MRHLKCWPPRLVYTFVTVHRVLKRKRNSLVFQLDRCCVLHSRAKPDLRLLEKRFLLQASWALRDVLGEVLAHRWRLSNVLRHWRLVRHTLWVQNNKKAGEVYSRQKLARCSSDNGVVDMCSAQQLVLHTLVEAARRDSPLDRRDVPTTKACAACAAGAEAAQLAAGDREMSSPL